MEALCAIVRAASSAPGSGNLGVLGDCSGGVGVWTFWSGILERVRLSRKKPSA